MSDRMLLPQEYQIWSQMIRFKLCESGQACAQQIRISLHAEKHQHELSKENKMCSQGDKFIQVNCNAKICTILKTRY